MNKKDSLPPIGNIKQMEADAQTAARAAAAAAQMNAGKDDTPNKKAEGSMIQNQQLMIMQAQVLVDQVQSCKAEIMVLQNELQRNIINAGI